MKGTCSQVWDRQKLVGTLYVHSTTGVKCILVNYHELGVSIISSSTMLISVRSWNFSDVKKF